MASLILALPILDSLPTSTSSSLPNSPESSDVLEDAAFLVVVAGEFNGGKSTFINALIGEEAMETGPLPTTDRLVVVGSKGVNGECSGSNVDDVSSDVGLYFHPASSSSSALSDITLVDTPGTNAVSELGHTALTRRLLPNADLVVFVTTAEQAMSESERGVLEVVKGWGKRVVVVVNKVDILSREERGEVMDFVRRKVGGVFDDVVEVVGVSSKWALEAKVAAGKDGGCGG